MPVATANDAKLKPFGIRIARFAYRDPAQDAKFNILCGAVRASKTWATFPKFFSLCAYRVAGHKVITGVSKAAIYRNFLSDIFELVGEKNYSYNRNSGELRILGSKWMVIGAKDEGSERWIRGMTVGVAVCDELTLMPQSFWQMLISRMSPAGARLYATTNPDNPFHWVKADVLDNPRLVRGLGKDLWYQTFTLDDNPNLTEDYKQQTKRSYTGVFFKRFILGLWVMAQGAIYGDVLGNGVFYDDGQRPIGLLSQNGHVDHFVSCDYGTTNPQCYGNYFDDGHTLWMEHEYTWDSRLRLRQKTDREYANDLINGCPELNWPAFPADRRLWPSVIVDPSAASFKAELRERGVVVIDGENEVENGIRRTSAMFNQRKLRINQRCRIARQELEAYAWDEKAAKLGEDKPIKSHDHHCFVAGTRVRTPGGQVNIENLGVGDLVSTPFGAATVLAIGSRKAITVQWNDTRVTPEHPALTRRGLVPVDQLRYADSVCAWNELFLMESSIVATLIQSALQIGATFGRVASISRRALRRFTVRSGRNIADRFRMATTFITGMEILVTTTSPTLSCSLHQNIRRCTADGLRQQDESLGGEHRKPLNGGTNHQPDESGTAGNPGRTTISESRASILASTVETNLAQKNTRETFCSVLLRASKRIAVKAASILSPQSARYAMSALLRHANTASPAPVVQSAEESCDTVYMVKTSLGCYFANDILVSNCDQIRMAVNTKINDWRIAA